MKNTKPKHGTERQHLIKPSAFESENTSHKSEICTQGISPLPGAICAGNGS